MKETDQSNVPTVDLYGSETLQEPFNTYDYLMRSCPIARDKRHANYVLARYQDVQRLADNDWLSAADGVDPAGRFPPGTYPDIERTDPPRHARLRALLRTAFSARQTARWEATVVEIFDECFAQIKSEHIDIIDTVCYPAPAHVICRIMGFPASRRSDYRRWSRALMSRLGQTLSDQDRASLIEMARFVRAQIAQRRSQPGDDLLSQLISAEVDGEHLTDNELVAHGVFLLAAGHETTTNLLGSIVDALINNPSLIDQLRARPDEIPALVEEVLRLESPIQSICRSTHAPKCLHEVAIPADARVLFLLGAASRDPERFASPDTLDLTRSNSSRHMAFGYGSHLCLGAPLARLEARVFTQGLLKRFARIRRSGAARRWESVVVRGFHELNIQVERRS